MEGADIVDMLQCPHAAMLDGLGIVGAHLTQPDTAALGMLLAEKLQSFF